MDGWMDGWMRGKRFPPFARNHPYLRSSSSPLQHQKILWFFFFSFSLHAFLDAFFINSLIWRSGLQRYVKYVSTAYIPVTYC